MSIIKIFILFSTVYQSFGHPIVETNNGLIEGRTYYINGKIMNTFKVRKQIIFL